jgi:hypothetical protein
VAYGNAEKLTLISALVVLLACGGTPSAREMRPGDTAPMLETLADPGETVVVWVSRPEDYLLCQSPALILRQLQRRYGARVRILAVSLDDEDGGLALTFFRAERVNARVLRMKHQEWQRLAGNTEVPTLYVSRNHRIVQSWTSSVGVRGAGTGSRPSLATTVDSLFHGADGTSPPDLNSI